MIGAFLVTTVTIKFVLTGPRATLSIGSLGLLGKEGSVDKQKKPRKPSAFSWL
ncbi:hypothetical protein GP5015_731 [gamma proteobacterium HTCC5015]|nr:hypothetical protein GP5015_731 [gamma proteobacterium HTCC5015]